MARIKESKGYQIYSIINYIFLITLAVLCLAPMVNVLAVSFSSQAAIAAGKVYLWPVEFNLSAYDYLIKKAEFWKALVISLERVLLGGGISMFLTVLSAYPLSKSSSTFKSRTFYAWFMLFTILFTGGMIPTYLVVRWTGLIDTIWALVIPDAIQVFNIVLLLNFFRQLPKELEEAAFIDGAGHWTTLWKIYVPVSKASLATLVLFVFVGHWNSWFDGLIYMNRTEHYPLQTYMQTVMVNGIITVKNASDLDIIRNLSNDALLAAQIFVGMIPVLCVYPFLQKYFTKGLILGSVKG